MQKHEEEKFTFKPDISISVLKGDKACLRPLYERIDEVIKKR